MILDDIVRDKKKRLLIHKMQIDPKLMTELAISSERKSISFYNALAKEGLSIIGEFKKASPSMGVIDNQLQLTTRIDQYNQSVDAISVLTEEDHFNGGVEYLKEIRSISGLPIIRKDLTATGAALFNMECKVYMGLEDMERQELNVLRMEMLGAKVIPVTSGSNTLKDATNEAIRTWAKEAEDTFYIIGSVVGPHPYPEMVKEFQRVISKESKQQILEKEGRLPDTVIACLYF